MPVAEYRAACYIDGWRLLSSSIAHSAPPLKAQFALCTHTPDEPTK
jgi:hypothetical protein